MASDYFYSCCWNITPPTRCVVFKSAFCCAHCTQLGRLYDVKKFLDKELEYVSRAYKRVDIQFSSIIITINIIVSCF